MRSRLNTLIAPARVQGWFNRVAGRPTGKLVFSAALGLGFVLDDPLLLGPLLDGSFPQANFVGDVIGTVLLMYLFVGAYGLYIREPFRDDDCQHDSDAR